MPDPNPDPDDEQKATRLLDARSLIEKGAYGKAYAALRGHRHTFINDPEFWLLYGIALQFMGAVQACEAAFRRLRTLNPATKEMQARHGRLLADCGDFGASRTLLWATAAQGEPSTECLVAAARVAEVFGDTTTAKKAYGLILANNPNHAESLTNLGNIKKKDGALDEAESLYRIGLKANPRSATLHRNLSDLLLRTVRQDEAIDVMDQCVALAPQNPYFMSDLIFAQHYSSRYGLADLSASAKHWGNRFDPPETSAPAHSNGETPPRLRISMLSGSFRQHPVGFLALPGLENLDRNRFSVTGYANQTDYDGYTERFRFGCDRWRPVAHLPDDRLETLIREDEIDVLIEMSGHAAGNRLPVVAKRVAPVQVKLVGGQFNTTGLAAMDFFLSDGVESPPEQDPYFCEEIIRLPNAYACYEPPADLPPVSSLPAFDNGTSHLAA